MECMGEVQHIHLTALKQVHISIKLKVTFRHHLEEGEKYFNLLCNSKYFSLPLNYKVPALSKEKEEHHGYLKKIPGTVETAVSGGNKITDGIRYLNDITMLITSHNNKNFIRMLTQNKRLIGIVFTVALLLFIPFIAMQFSDEVRWSSFDFILMGVLLLGTGLMCEWVLRKVKKREYRVALCLGLLALLFLVWAELAVGIFGTPFAGS